MINSTRVVSRLKRNVTGAAKSRGLRLRLPVTPLSREFDEQNVSAIAQVGPFTMTPPQRIVALRDAVDYVVRAGVSGAIVECGVWRGGSMMAAAYALQEHGVTDRELWLYDTFSGMTAPTDFDNTIDGIEGKAWFAAEQERPEAGSSGVTGVCLAEVKANIASTGYPAQRVTYVEGPVEDTLTTTYPKEIALLRLDTDFYESTCAELDVLYPRLVPGGVLILDDYGYWQGARKAVDEYFADKPVLFNRVDASARLMVKAS